MSRTSFRQYLSVIALLAIVAVPAATFASGTNSTASTTSTTPAISPQSATKSAGKSSGDIGEAQAIRTITDSMKRQEASLRALLPTVPASAQPGVQKAIDVTAQGRAAALDILGAIQTTPKTTGTAAGNGKATSPEKDLGQVRKIVIDTRNAAEQDLSMAMRDQPKQVRDRIESVMKEVRTESGQALAAVQHMSREERTESASAEAHERERGETGTRASMATRPARPEMPQHR